MAMEIVAKAKVAKVIGDHEVAFNKGEDAGIEVGDSIVISDRVEIMDPDTNESLGAVLVSRIRFTVSMVAKKYCLAKVADRRKREGAGSWKGLQPLKGVTDDVFEESNYVVLVKIGEPAVVRRPANDEDEPPF